MNVILKKKKPVERVGVRVERDCHAMQINNVCDYICDDLTPWQHLFKTIIAPSLFPGLFVFVFLMHLFFFCILMLSIDLKVTFAASAKPQSFFLCFYGNI